MGFDLIGRLLLAAFFGLGALQKVTAPEVVQGLLAGADLPEWLIWPALLVNAALALGWPLAGGCRKRRCWSRPIAVSPAPSTSSSATAGSCRFSSRTGPSSAAC